MPASRRPLAAATLLTLGAAAAIYAVRGKHVETTEERWGREAEATRIVRDDWGIAHVHGKTDADAVFGMIYAQAEDDFERIETNYLDAMGRLAEVEGREAIFRDLRAKLFVDSRELRATYASSPEWLKGLMVAWADGLNFFLRSHPQVRPRVLLHFEPWMALSFTEGSIGGDIERVPLDMLEGIYGSPGEPGRADVGSEAPTDAGPVEPGGSNGIAIAPSRTASHHTLLLINPHTSFFFRSELQVTSDEGLDVYGAATWGQFFVYQGFNDRVGWMHTSSGVDSVDFFEETVENHNGEYFYRYGQSLRPVETTIIRVPYGSRAGPPGERAFTVYRTHHGPVVGQKDGRWLSVALMQKPIEALSQSFLLTRARNYDEFMKAMELHANSSNNTVYADADGHVAYLHPQFVPRRNDRFDFTRPVDGADPETDWHGLHTLDEVPHVLDPPTGWIMNTNDWPYSAAGPDSPKPNAFPRYMDTAGENPRGVHAAMLLSGGKDFTADSLDALAFDPYLPAFERLIPALVHDHECLADSSPQKARLAEAVAVLREWDHRWSSASLATTLAVLWGDEIRARFRKDPEAAGLTLYEMAERTGSEQRLMALSTVCDRLLHDFGTWRVPWGNVNRYQRTTGELVPRFSDDTPSFPVPFTAGIWGSLASFAARRYEGTAKYYGTAGNSFVAIVELGDRVSARAVSIGGESGHPGSKHFDDQVSRYTSGALRKVYFYPDELQGHVEVEYQPR